MPRTNYKSTQWVLSYTVCLIIQFGSQPSHVKAAGNGVPSQQVLKCVACHVKAANNSLYTRTAYATITFRQSLTSQFVGSHVEAANNNTEIGELGATFRRRVTTMRNTSAYATG